MSSKSVQTVNNMPKVKELNKSYSELPDLVKTQVMGVGLTNATEQTVLEYIREILQKTQKNIYIVTPNPEIFIQSLKNPLLKTSINSANLALIDGVGLLLAGKIMGKSLEGRIIGTNLMETLCEKAVDWPITVGFLGGRPGVAVKVSECLREKHPGLQVVFADSEWENFEPQKPIDILFVAFGAPKQEIWMKEHINNIPVRVMMGVGGAFDQIVYPTLRPPQLFSNLGLAWLYRLFMQPWRIKRQLALIAFIFYVLKQRFLAK